MLQTPSLALRTLTVCHASVSTSLPRWEFNLPKHDNILLSLHTHVPQSVRRRIVRTTLRLDPMGLFIYDVPGFVEHLECGTTAVRAAVAITITPTGEIETRVSGDQRDVIFGLSMRDYHSALRLIFTFDGRPHKYKTGNVEVVAKTVCSFMY